MTKFCTHSLSKLCRQFYSSVPTRSSITSADFKAKIFSFTARIQQQRTNHTESSKSIFFILSLFTPHVVRLPTGVDKQQCDRSGTATLLWTAIITERLATNCIKDTGNVPTRELWSVNTVFWLLGDIRYRNSAQGFQTVTPGVASLQCTISFREHY
jgi:hypothetical protein